MAIIGEIQGGRSRSIIELSTSTSLTPATIQSALQRLLQVHLIVAIHSDSFRLNHDFTSPYSRLNLSVSSTEADQIVLSEAGKENLEDHSFALQAQVVRFLKKRTTCTIDDVQGEIGRGVDELMRILETLREKEYVRIDDNNLTYIP